MRATSGAGGTWSLMRRAKIALAEEAVNAIAASAVRCWSAAWHHPGPRRRRPLFVSQNLIGWDLIGAGPLPASPAAPVHHVVKGFTGPAGGCRRLVFGTWPAQGDGT